MFPFLNKKGKKKTVDHDVEASKLVDTDSATDHNTTIETELSIHPDWQLPDEEKYVLAFHNTNAKPLHINQLSLATVDYQEKEDGYQFIALIRQTLTKSIKLDKTAIILLDDEHKTIARKEFDLSKAGSIPSNGSRPWEFHFKKKEIPENLGTPNNNWSLAFELKPKHQLDLAESWKESLADDSIKKLEEIVASAKPLKPGEVNLLGVSAGITADNQVTTTILIRNGSDKNLTIEQLPLLVKDASGEIVAKGGFQLDALNVKSNTSKPWTFIFPEASILKDTSQIDLSKWSVEAIQNK
ncbi:hypothetical protein JCM21714_4373 [Gracilibacillus boraciitolerans JCM 21714]|uniref:Accessory Sec system S-layer assembly protein n=1 Tax=Gracilibacillus boraciitolerans JCM 21714 TaxID=1298598 RepID=W4VP44_9BACI|nr:accessory Sec system S-layer assembly protein [Gracilibacillus boraciitolerans]GAE95160.1 hypothetical protein JCM21714_4373 [Gracilibacillus boraciitolerans JCM 21714]